MIERLPHRFWNTTLPDTRFQQLSAVATGKEKREGACESEREKTEQRGPDCEGEKIAHRKHTRVHTCSLTHTHIHTQMQSHTLSHPIILVSWDSNRDRKRIVGDTEKKIEFPDINTELGWGGQGIKMETGIYRKEAAVDMYIQSESAHPESLKIGMIKGEIIDIYHYGLRIKNMRGPGLVYGCENL